MRNTVLLALLLGGGGLGIGLAVAKDAPMPTERPDFRPGLPNPPITRACEEIEADARALVDDARQCDASLGGGACEVVSLETLVDPDSCVGAFQCAAALSPDLDRRAFVERARALEEEKIACGECAQAACQPPAELAAECIEGVCELMPRQSQPRLPTPGVPRP